MGITKSTSQGNVKKEIPELKVPFGKKIKNSDSCLESKEVDIPLTSAAKVGQIFGLLLDDETGTFWLVDGTGQRVYEYGRDSKLLKCVGAGYTYRAIVLAVNSDNRRLRIEGALK